MYGNDEIEKAAVKAAAEAKKRGKFFNLREDGDRAIVVFLPDLKNPKDAYIYAEQVVGGFGKPKEPYDPSRHQESEARMRIKWGIYVLKTGSPPRRDGIADRSDVKLVKWEDVKRMQVFEGGLDRYTVWNNQYKKFGLGWFYEIERHGKAGDQKTTYTFDRTDPIPEDFLRDVLRMDYPKLDVAGEDDADATGGGNGASAAPQPPPDSPIPDEIGDDIVRHMKEMPNDPASGKAFVKHFQIPKLRALPRGRTAEAMAWVQALKTLKEHGKITPTTDVDATIALVTAQLAGLAGTAGGKDPFAQRAAGATTDDY
jgi:hypothetical protein